MSTTEPQILATAPDLTHTAPKQTPNSLMTFLALLCILAVAFTARYINFPHRYEVRDMDETGYLDGGLVMWEGITPGIRVAPAAVETWTTWLYAAFRSSIAIIRPEPAIKAAPWQLRPYLAIDAVLFDIYADMSGLHRLELILEFVIAMGGIYAAFQFGRHYGGLGCAILIGGTVALLPLYVDFAGMTRPYSNAWAFSFLALSSAAGVRGTRRWIQTGLFLGLAISSRIEMLGITPVILWQFWEDPSAKLRWPSALKSITLAILLLLLLAPWMEFQIIGVLRTIATTRLMTWASTGHPRLLTLSDLTWTQGLAPLLILTLVAVPLAPPGRRVKRWSLTLFVALLASSMFSGPYQPTRYHGAPIVAMIALAGITVGPLLRHEQRLGPILIAVALALPAVQTGRYLAVRYSGWVPEEATNWIEQHVPAGTRVYDSVDLDLRCPLPTAESSDALWAQVDDAQSWRKKFARGLSRLDQGNSYLPRALSEDNMVLDRGLWRRYFILGNSSRTNRPRYNLQIYHISPVLYGIPISDVPADFTKNGGVVVWRDIQTAPMDLGAPAMQWTNAAGDRHTYIYCSADVKANLR